MNGYNFMVKRIHDLDKMYAVRLSERRAAIQRKKDARSTLESLKKELESALAAMKVVQEVGESVQKYAYGRLENLVSYALKDVFGEEAYTFRVKVTHRKAATAVEFFLERDGELYTPKDEAGYGAIDVACFALRIAVWTLNPNTPTLVFDEPFRNLSVEYHDRIAEFVYRCAKDLKVQLIVVTHISALASNGDNVIVIHKKKGKADERKTECTR